MSDKPSWVQLPLEKNNYFNFPALATSQIVMLRKLAERSILTLVSVKLTIIISFLLYIQKQHEANNCQFSKEMLKFIFQATISILSSTDRYGAILTKRLLCQHIWHVQLNINKTTEIKIKILTLFYIFIFNLLVFNKVYFFQI